MIPRESSSRTTALDPPVVSEGRSEARDADPELAARFERYQSAMGLSVEHADLLTRLLTTSDFFEAAVSVQGSPVDLAAWMATDLRGLLGDRSLTDLTFGGEGLGALVALVESGRLTRRAAKDVLARMVLDGGDPESLMSEMGLEVMGVGDALGAAVDEVLGRWPDKVDGYRAGNKNLLGMFVGQVMKATGGAADPHAVRSILSERLDS